MTPAAVGAPGGPAPAPTADEAAQQAREEEASAVAAPVTPGTRAPSDREQPEGAVEVEGELGTQLVEEEETGLAEETTAGARPRRRRRGGRGRRGRGGEDTAAAAATGTVTAAHVAEEQAPTTPELAPTDQLGQAPSPAPAGGEAGPGEGETETAVGPRRRRRRRRRAGESETAEVADGTATVVRVREPRAAESEVTGVRGSTRLEAKRHRRRESREVGRRRPPVVTESEFLARRESVDRVMVVRQVGDRTQIGVLEDGVLVEHYINREASTSYVGNIYLGRVQNVLPGMEAAFVDIGKGRNAVLYAGEVNWDAAGLEDRPKRIEEALKPGDSVLVQVTKDPIGHKGGRLTSQISLPGRFVAYVPTGSMTGISRKLPDTERARLKRILRQVLPDGGGVIVRTAAEGASEEDIAQDVERLRAQWEQLEAKAKTASAPALLYAEPDLAIRVVRDIFNEDFTSLVVSGDQAWAQLQDYLTSMAPDLASRARRWTGDDDVFAHYRIDEQLTKALDRKVWLPSGGYLIIDWTEAMVVIDVNTGKFTGKAGANLEETITRNNLEAAEEIVRQMRLRDLGGIIVIDFVDMVLESNRDLVMRRLIEALGRDRTRHQVAEVTSLGLVQMTRKRIGQGLLEAFSQPCEVCNGRGVRIVMDTPPVRRVPDLRSRPVGASAVPVAPSTVAPPVLATAAPAEAAGATSMDGPSAPAAASPPRRGHRRASAPAGPPRS